MFYGFLAFLLAALLGVFAFALLPSSRSRGWALAAYLLAVLVIYVTATEILGNPKPYSLEWRSLTGVPVIGFHPDRDRKRLYLWVLRGREPVTYVLPLSDDEQTAEVEARFRQRQQTGDEFFLDLEKPDDPKVKVIQRPELPPK